MTDGSSRLEWREARRDDRSTLQQFVCTTPEKETWAPIRRSRYHPRKWELDAQSTVRILKPPAPSGERIRVGFDSQGLAAVINIAKAKNDDHGVTLQLVALAQRLRRAEPRYGQELMDESIRIATEFRVQMGEAVGVFARVHPKNAPSRRLFEASGFENLGLSHIEEPAPGPDPRHKCVDCVETWVVVV